MTNFERDAEARQLADSRTAYNLARQVIDLQEKLKRAQDQLDALRADKQLGAE